MSTFTIDSNIQKIIYNSAEINKLVYNGHVVWEAGPIDYSTRYLTIVSTSDNNTIGWKTNNSSLTKTISVSIDDGQTWTNKTSNTSGVTLATLNIGDKLLIKGINNTYSQSSPYNSFTSTGQFNVEGNIMSLIYGDSFIGQTSLPETYTFRKLFVNSKIVDASNLILPATTLTNYCYASMFEEYSLLTNPPALPATTLADGCYQYMFKNCNKMTTAPALPATTLIYRCYYYMFQGCTALITAPELPATTLANQCYQYMFYQCTGLTNAPELPATTLATNCYRSMFVGCTSLTTAPELLATTLVQGCYQYMFNGCTNLNYIKCLATSISATDCTTGWVTNVAASGTFIKDSSMNSWTTGVNGIPAGWTVITPNHVEYLTFEIVDGGTIGLKTNGTIGSKTLSYKINNGEWTSISTSSSNGGVVYIQNLVAGDRVKFKGTNNAYASWNTNYMNFEGGSATFNIMGNIMSLVGGDDFTNTTSLTGTYNFCSLFKLSNCLSAENLILPVLTLTQACYRAMFSKSTLTVAPKILPATTLHMYVYWYMFENCPIVIAPELPFTGALPAYSYGNMFTGCTRLNYIKCLATNISANSCTSNWVKNVSSSGTFVKNTNATWTTTGNNGVPTNWTIQYEAAA